MLFHYDGIVDDGKTLPGVIDPYTSLPCIKPNGGMQNDSCIRTLWTSTISFFFGTRT
ncbi:hypothetical protein M758_UG028700 [Ceratodon purpureus]|nr:hypothetical protein M758_UG028700 [Ceratodon purpureus]